ncbi:hypothetical protein GCM10009679_75470 [Saccharothrix algeriensis]|uniref:Uncharacterized protein n=1 Tax=Catellatospora bangladeshensis TaxID=310355 RepID=A0A8J3JPZ6_9ACTN|nr:hypothetical protein Cba03nite_61450 [Catellatospora bangladeshensis]
MTRETVGTLTPARRAIAAIVTLRLSSTDTGSSFVTASAYGRNVSVQQSVPGARFRLARTVPAPGIHGNIPEDRWGVSPWWHRTPDR